MTTGFILDQNQGPKVSNWIEGRPEKGFWGMKVKGRRQFEINADRCEKCGFLELYA